MKKSEKFNQRKFLRKVISHPNFPFTMVLYDHSKIAKLKRESRRTTTIQAESEKKLDKIYYADYYPRWERVLQGKTEDILKKRG